MDRYFASALGIRTADSPALWLGRKGAMGMSGIRQMLGRRSDEAGIARINPHAFRHFFAHS
jgi:site-specific recombinase XerD